MRPTDITRLRRADVFVTLGGAGVDAWRRRACYCSIVSGEGSEYSLRGNKSNISNGLCHFRIGAVIVISLLLTMGRSRAEPLRGQGVHPAPSRQIALAAMFTVSASSAVLKKNETTPWAITVRRIGCDATATSETWQVMPTTKEK